ncbi:MAG TPA: hypothetical protein DEB06_01515 [Phycisphaerales bacterium]|nr:hypothetical protein [Phycisphaerales bacterium]
MMSAGASAERRGVERGAWLGAAGEFDAGACFHCRVLAERTLLEEGDDSRRFEAATGRDLRNYAPTRGADLLHMRLDFDIPDMNTPRLTAKQTLSFSPVGKPLTTLELDAEQLDISKVRLADDTRSTLSFTHDGSRLAISFDPPLEPGAKSTVEIEYALARPTDGLFWTPESPQWPGRPAQIHTQGQPETNRYWFPVHDSPNERLTTEIVATVPEGFLVSANGREASKPVTRDGRTTFHWLQDKPHVPYLVSMIVGKFDVQDVAPAGFRFPMPVYVPPGKGDQIRQTYGRTADMVRAFEARFDEPFPWDRYAQLVVWNFGAGGMENTSATTMYDTAILDAKALQDADLEGLISHELAHQWFGDLITCNTWAHIWLNEGWATYSTNLWLEARDGYDRGYRNAMHRTMRGIASSDTLDPGATNIHPPMVSRVYSHPWEVFRRTANPYPKGASILHMLRMKLGDELFFKGVAAYIDRHKFTTVETDDFRRAMEEASGRSLEQFFDQWCHRPGTPKVAVKARWDSQAKALRVTVDQQQLIDADHPAFVFDLPFEVHTNSPATPEPVRFVIPVDSKRHEHTVALEAEPTMLLVDPDLHVLMTPSVEIPAGWLRNQLTTQRSIASRLDAALFVKGKAGAATERALASVLMDPTEFHSVRSAAARALGDLSADDALADALERGIDDARPRDAAITALGRVGGPRAPELLARLADDESESYACRSAAFEGLGKRGSASHLPIFARGLASSSQHEQVRTGALNGLRDLRLPEGLDMVIPLTQFGNLNRVRPVAIRALADLSEFDKRKAFDAIAPLLYDSEDRARDAAIEALVKVKDDRGLDALDRLASTTTHEPTRELAKKARADLAAALRRPDAVRALEAEVDKVKNDLKRLETRLKKDE